MIKLVSITVMALCLTACGFTPVHAPLGGQKAVFQDIKIETLATKSLDDQESGFFLEQRLKDRIGVNGSKYVLRIDPKLSERQLGISSSDIASRYDFILNTRYQLLDSKTGDTLTKGTVRSQSTFAAPDDPYGQEASESNATRTIAADNADRVLAKLAAYFARN